MRPLAEAYAEIGRPRSQKREAERCREAARRWQPNERFVKALTGQALLAGDAFEKGAADDDVGQAAGRQVFVADGDGDGALEER